MRRFFEKILKQKNQKRAARLENNSETDLFVRQASEQLRILAKRGLSIPIFTL